MRYLSAALLFALAAASAQETKPPETKPADPVASIMKPTPYEAAIIPVKILSGDSFNRLAAMLQVFGAKYAYDNKLRTIIVYAPKDVTEKMRQVVAELDRADSEAAGGRNIEINLTFLKCYIKAQTPSEKLPADLEAVAKQIRAATQYKDIELWDTAPMHVQEGKIMDQSVRLPGNLPSAPRAYTTGTLQIHPESVSRRDNARFVRLERLRINLRVPTPAADTGQWNYMDVGLTTAGDFKEGQKTVLGKVSGLDDQSAVFVVVSLKILD